MNILILNAGSSSLKFMVIDMPSEHVLGKGIIERIGEKDAIATGPACKAMVCVAWRAHASRNSNRNTPGSLLYASESV